MKTRIIKRKGTLLSSVAMLSTAMLLTACGGDGGDSPVDDGGANPGESGAQALLYAYPDNGQGEVSTAAPVVLRFSSAVNLGEAQNSITVYEGDAQSGTVVAVTPESVAGEPNNVLLQPDEDLKPNQIYTVVIEDLRLRKGTAKDQTLTFTTRPLHEGPKSLVVKEDTFEVSRRMPDGSAMEPVMDFSSFRFQFTQPIDRATANYGDGNTVVLRDGAGDPVDATLLIDGAYMTVDPDAEYLNAGETYTLDITADLASTYGETFGAQSYTLTPKDSSPKGEPAILVQKLTQGSTSRLTGKPVNEVPVNGTLLGENKNITQASAEVVRAELADVTTYTDVTPIRLPKGTVLNGAEISPILIGGEVPAGFGSGDVTMTVLSDASGYLVPNPYAENNPDALRIVHLLMDVGIATSEARANGAFTQDLLHIELVGLAEVDPTAGVLNLDAVSVVEPNILGQEYGYGMLSFQLQSYKDQNNPPEVVKDTTRPELQSWTLGQSMSPEDGNKEGLYTPGDSIILNFNESLDSDSVSGNILLYKNDQLMDLQYYVDGSALVITPKLLYEENVDGNLVVRTEESIDYISEANPDTYRVEISGEVTDMAGNNIDGPITENIEMPLKVTEKEIINPKGTGSTAEYDDIDVLVEHSPVLLSAYPGFPCALSEDGRDIGNLLAGRCKGGFPGVSDGTEVDNKPVDDSIPIVAVPQQRPIVVQFSKNMDKNSFALGQTFKVEEINSDGSSNGEIKGTLLVNDRIVKFFPEQGWEKGTLYSYTIASSGYEEVLSNSQNIPVLAASDNYTCGVNSVCDTDGFPLQTQTIGITTVRDIAEPEGEREKIVFLTGPNMAAGGPSLVQYFKGGEPDANVLQVLTTQPVSDRNANYFHERANPFSTPPVGSTSGEYAYENEEYGPTNESDVRYPQYDPNGVAPSKNSAKLLSRYNEYNGDPSMIVEGANFGCGYQPFSEVPLECPSQKFTFLNAGLVAEVTDQYVEGRGIKVLIWPTQIIGTSVDIFALGNFGVPVSVGGETGPQILRMRYEKDDLGNRTQPVTGWISDNGSGLELQADVDLYLTAPYVTTYGVGSTQNTVNMSSYEISMNLTGPVKFLDDGRMIVEQFNTNPVDIMLFLHGKDNGNLGGYVDLFIPEYGSRLNFVSQPIK